MSEQNPAILIGMDATEADLVDRLVAEGRMPALAALRERGRFGRLQTQPPSFLSMVWPTFYGSQTLAQHGWYFNKQWRAEHQRVEYMSPNWVPNRVFWEGLDPALRVAALDLPFAARPPERLNGVFFSGWQCHDDFGRPEYPRGFRAQTERRHGAARLGPEVFGEQTARTLLRQRAEVLESDAQFAAICRDLLRRERWDLFLAVFGATHRGTHYLWDLSQIDTAGVDADVLATLRGARDDCYVSWDKALGRVVEAAPPQARFLVFSLHGMEPNDGWFEYLPRMLQQVHAGGASAAAPKEGLLFRVKKVLPWRWVRQVTRRIPHAWNKALVPLWSRRMYDWSKTRYFGVPMDYNGYIRLNLRGREPEGIVDPAHVDALCAEIREGLLSFRDLEDGGPVVADVVRVDETIGSDAPRRDVLPDLVVLWHRRRRAQESGGVVSQRYGEVRWPKGAKLFSGRSGNHTDHGWFVACGPGIEPGRSGQTHDTVDLMPTVFRWIGSPQPDFFQGRPIAELTTEHQTTRA